MKKIKILFLIGLTILTLFSVCSCSVVEDVAIEMKRTKYERFITTYDNGSFYIIADMETKVQYLVYTGGYKGGITVLVDETGKPLLYT